MENLWPLLEKPATNTPKSILGRQVEFFNAQDNGLKAYLHSEAKAEEIDFDEMHLIRNGFEGEYYFHHTMRIQAPSLGGFSIPLLKVRQKVTETYPVVIYDMQRNVTFRVLDEAEFLQKLKHILTSKETIQALETLIAQSK
jgi:hypothetical protein